MEAQHELIAEYMTKRTQALDVNGEQSGIVNWFLMTKEDQLADFDSFIQQKTNALAQDKIQIETFAATQIAEVDAKIDAVVEFEQGLPAPIVIVVEEPIELPIEPIEEPLPIEPVVEEPINE